MALVESRSQALPPPVQWRYRVSQATNAECCEACYNTALTVSVHQQVACGCDLPVLAAGMRWYHFDWWLLARRLELGSRGVTGTGTCQTFNWC